MAEMHKNKNKWLVYQLQPLALADNPYPDLGYSGYH